MLNTRNIYPKPAIGLIVTAIWELARHDIVNGLLGFSGVYKALRRCRPAARSNRRHTQEAVCEALCWATSLYLKPVRCLQRSMATARLLRRNGLDAVVVIGYRLEPFLGHAWVEIDGKVINDSSVYRERLRVLERA